MRCWNGIQCDGSDNVQEKAAKTRIEHIEVKNYRIEDVPETSDLIVVHRDLEERTRRTHPSARIIGLSNYLQDPKIDALIEEVLQDKKIHEKQY